MKPNIQTAPLRRNYGLSASLLTGIIIFLVILVAFNTFLALNTSVGASFYSYWRSARILFAQGGDPYSFEQFAQIQNIFPTDANISGFVYPLYALLLVLPFSFISNFTIALILWMLINEMALFFCAFRIISVLRLSSLFSRPFFCIAMLFLSYYAFISVTDGDFNILSLFFLILGADAALKNEKEVAGIFLALSLIKFSLTLLPLIWICVWCLRHRRGTVVTWALMVWGLLLLLATLFMSDWIPEFLRSCIYYLNRMEPVYFVKILSDWQPELGGRIGWAISALLGILLLLEWGLNAWGGRRAFEWTLSLTLCVGFLLNIPNLGKNLFLLNIPLFYALDKINLRWKHSGKRFSIVVLFLFLALPWGISVRSGSIFNPVHAINIVLPFVVFLLLYWNRWWNLDSVIDEDV